MYVVCCDFFLEKIRPGARTSKTEDGGGSEISIKQDNYSTSVCHKVTFCIIYIISYGSVNFTSAS